MTLFQLLAISVLAILLLGELARLRPGESSRFQWLRMTVWAAAALAIAFPGWVQRLADALGIHRGADLVFYFFVLAYLMTTFYLYAKIVRLQRQVTQLVRHQALQEAEEPRVDRAA